MTMNGYVIQHVKYVFYYPQKVLNMPNIFVNVLILTGVSTLVYISYFKICQGFKERIKTIIPQWNRIQRSLWRVVCYLSMIMATYVISTHLPDAVDDFSVQETNPQAEVAFSFIFALHLHQFCLSWKSDGFNSLSLRWMLANMAFCLSFVARCLRIGVSFVVTSSVVSLIIEIISLSVNVTEMLSKKVVGTKVSISVAVFFGAVWTFFYLYLYPIFVLLPVAALNSTNSSVSFISLLLFTLWGEYLLDWYTSPLMRIIWMSITRSFPSNWLSSIFLIPNNDVNEKLLLIRKGAIEKEQTINSQLLHREKLKSRQNSQAIIQTVRCVLLLKKKLRRMRERKNLDLGEESTERELLSE